MKRDEIKSKIPDITPEQLDWLMAEHGREVQTITAQRDDLQTRLTEASTKLEGYDPDWKQKADEAEQAAKARVDALTAEYAAEKAVAGLKFSSTSARKAFLTDLIGKKLPTQDGALLGFDDFVEQYKKSDPGAFAPDVTPPIITAPVGGGNNTPVGHDAVNAAFRAAFGKD